MKRIIVTTVISLLIFGGSGYWLGYENGKNTGHNEGVISGNTTGYEKGYSLGYDNGKEFVVTHLDQYVTIPKAVAYEEVLEFLKEDRTDESEYTDDYNCISFADDLKERANNQGIKCALVSMDLVGDYDNTAHAINAFETIDRGIVYFDPQTDGQRYGIYVGGVYRLSELYKITKVDVIW